MKELFGFGQPLDYRAMLWEPGILTTAWGPVVRVIAALRRVPYVVDAADLWSDAAAMATVKGTLNAPAA